MNWLASSTIRPSHTLEVMPFSIASERIILAEWKPREFVRHQDSSQVRVASEFHPVHVVDLTLHPVGSDPETGHGWQFGVGVVGESFDEDPLASGCVGEAVDNAVPIFGIGIIQVVDAAEFSQHVEAVLFFEALQEREQNL